jgi:hypothetical protein
MMLYNFAVLLGRQEMVEGYRSGSRLDSLAVGRWTITLSLDCVAIQHPT